MSETKKNKKEEKRLRKEREAQERDAAAATKRAQKKKTLMITVVAAVVIVGFLFWLVQNAPEREQLLDETPTEINVVSEEDNVKGADEENAKVTIVEYSDFECPACRSYYPLIKQVVEDFPEDIRFVYRHLPIRTIHPNAELAARYAEAAGEQGMFFEMHDAIFENQPSWSGTSARAARNAFESYGEELGLDIEQLQTDADSDAIIEKIEAQRIDAVGAGAFATPTFFVDGELLTNNPQSYDDFVELVTGERPAPEPTVDTSALEGAMEEAPHEDGAMTQ